MIAVAGKRTRGVRILIREEVHQLATVNPVAIVTGFKENSCVEGSPGFWPNMSRNESNTWKN